MAEQSKLYALKPLLDKFPAVTRPVGHVPFSTKILWTVTILILYFVLGNVFIYGLSEKTFDLFSGFRAIIGGESGSLIHLGIMPIVDASIIMQLLAGAKIINLDLSKEEDQVIFHGTEKLLVFVFIVIMSIANLGQLPPASGLVENIGPFASKLVIVIQLIIGGILIFLMDEIVSKWGIGSGVSLFIVAGISQSVIVGLFSWFPEIPGEALGFLNPPAGALLRFGYLLQQIPELSGVGSLAGGLMGGGYEYLLIGTLNGQNVSYAMNTLVDLFGTVAIFIIVLFFETRRVEIPLAHGRVRGARGRFPIRLLYASVIPVILVSVILGVVKMITQILWTSSFPLLGHNSFIGAFDAQGDPAGGIAWFLQPVGGLRRWLLPVIRGGEMRMLADGTTIFHPGWHFILKIGIYALLMIGGSILFAKFWIETTGMSENDVAKQILSSQMQIPGFRSNPRAIKGVLSRYIPPITVLSGAIVGSLAVLSDLIGTVGGLSGTSVLLAVSIMMSIYEAVAREQAIEMHPVIRSFFGVE
jgi:preprotein translocase subunit SecY